MPKLPTDFICDYTAYNIKRGRCAPQCYNQVRILEEVYTNSPNTSTYGSAVNEFLTDVLQNFSYTSNGANYSKLVNKLCQLLHTGDI